MIDLKIMRKKRKRVVRDRPKIRWGVLTKDNVRELGEKLLAMGAWRSSGDASSMWNMMSNCIRKASREVLEVSKGYSRGNRGDC